MTVPNRNWRPFLHQPAREPDLPRNLNAVLMIALAVLGNPHQGQDLLRIALMLVIDELLDEEIVRLDEEIGHIVRMHR